MLIRLSRLLFIVFSVPVLSFCTKVTSENDHPSNSYPWKLDQACVREYEENEVNQDCMNSVINNARKSTASPECERQMKLYPWPNIDSNCRQELQVVYGSLTSEFSKCLKNPISKKCKMQAQDLATKQMACIERVSEAFKEVQDICGTGQEFDSECYKEHKKYLATVCDAL